MRNTGHRSGPMAYMGSRSQSGTEEAPDGGGHVGGASHQPYPPEWRGLEEMHAKEANTCQEHSR